MTFLPKGYEIPTSEGGYMKFAIGENRFRILGKPILGWETWIETPEGNKQTLRVKSV